MLHLATTLGRERTARYRARLRGEDVPLLKRGTKPRPIAERLAEKVLMGAPDDCWPYTGHPNKRGYGKIGGAEGKRGSSDYAHRAAWVVAFGPIPDGLWVLHHCDNPPCCNPAHLFLGDHDANMADAVRKGRMGKPRGEMSPNCKVTDEQIAEIRALYVSGQFSQHGLARRYGLSRSYIQRVVQNRSRLNA